MTLLARATQVFERLPLPDRVSRLAVSALVGRTHARLSGQAGQDDGFARAMRDFPVAEHAAAANAQHYELPPAFFAAMLGPARKYSCCVYASPDTSLADAEEAALAQTAEHAALADGQRILELGCGWGSLSLWMARRFPAATIVSVSNSASQRQSIEEQARARGLGNLTVITADMNDFDTAERFDRVVSVEMFEHMSNWHTLLGRIRGWLAPDGLLFLHVFTHANAPYRFDRNDKTDWIAQHFFTGGIMPSHALIGEFDDLFLVDVQWRWNGRHYARTARDWLRNFDRNRDAVRVLLRDVYGPDASLWHRRWRLFLLSTEGLFGYRGGTAWGVSHYRLKPRA